MSDTGKWKTWLVSYPCDGARWSLEIKARSREEAERHLKQMCFGRVDGEVELKIPVPGGGVVSRLFDWLKA